MIWLYNYVTFDKIKWLSAFTKYITIKFLTKPQSMYINEFMLTSFSPFDIKCKKRNLKNIQRVPNCKSPNCTQSWGVPPQYLLKFLWVMLQYSIQAPYSI